MRKKIGQKPSTAISLTVELDPGETHAPGRGPGRERLGVGLL